MRQCLDLIEVARLEESRCAKGISELAPFSAPFAGGSMCRGIPGGWMNAAYGAGLSGPVAHNEIDELILFYESNGIEPRVEICPMIHVSLIDGLAERKFVVRHFENVFFRELRPGEEIITPHPIPDALRFEPVDQADSDAIEQYARVSLSGFLPPDFEIPDELLEASRRVARHPRMTALRAFLGKECVGAGAIEVDGSVAALLGVTVLEPFRRRGVQQAMMAWRLRLAIARGASLATITTRPGIPTERNARRLGFQMAYTKTVLVRPGPNLVPVMD